MLGNPKAPDIMTELKELTSNGIRVHAQIVLCPGLNDGEELLSTIRDLQRFYPYVASVAVVPVGVTKVKKAQFRIFTKSEAVNVIETLKKIGRRFKNRHGDPLVYPADEFYILAEMPFPSLKEYGDLPQIENGVGMVPSFLSSSKKVKLPRRTDPVRVALCSGTSFSPYLRQFVSKLESIEGLEIELFTVENRFFGQTVTVSGLLTAKDILKSVISSTSSDILLVPDVALDSENEFFIDNVSIHDMEESLGIPVRPVESTPEGLLKGVIHGNKR
jgi:putative radical SAM enzyme (TIGR03279 family)